MRGPRALAWPTVAAALAAVPAFAQAGSGPAVRSVNVVKMFGAGVTLVSTGDGGVPVLLPTTLRLASPRASASTPKRGGYTMELDYREPCNGANVCMVAAFTAQRGSSKPYGRPVKLADGISGAYAGIQCGASCSPAAIQWREHGVLYTITATLGVELHGGSKAAVTAAFVAAADQAITAGPR